MTTKNFILKQFFKEKKNKSFRKQRPSINQKINFNNQEINGESVAKMTVQLLQVEIWSQRHRVFKEQLKIYQSSFNKRE